MQKRLKRRFAADFKSEVVRLVLEQGRSATDVARDHDLGPSLVRQAKPMRFAAIQGQAGDYPVRSMCQKLNVCPRGIYAWRNRAEKAQPGRDALLLTHIRVVHKGTHRTYGSPRVHRELLASGNKAGRHRVARLMSANGIIDARKKIFVRTTQSPHNLAIAPDLFKRDFSATGPNHKWVTEITYLRTANG